MKNILAKVLTWMSFPAVAALVVIGYWAFSVPNEVLTINKLPVPVADKTIKVGEYVPLHYNYCKNADASGIIKTTLVSDVQKIVLPDVRDESRKVCTDVIVPAVLVPEDTPDGIYHVHYRASYNVNPLNTNEIQEWDSEEFTITK